MPSASPKEVLRQTLPVKSVVSRPAYFAEQVIDAPPYSANTQFICIGRGSCGTVWEEQGTDVAFKTSPDQKALWVDFNLTNVVCRSFLQCKQLMESAFPNITVPLIPNASRFCTSSNTWWETACDRFPSEDMPKQGSAAMQVRRIHPLPSETREALIRLYFDPACHDNALADPENKDCLVRLYFGANERDTSSWRTSLRNFELYLDMGQHLKLDVENIIREMAVSLAILHWEAKCDAMDAEWVLGSVANNEIHLEGDREARMIEPKDVELGFQTRTTYLWILDFDKTRPIKYDRSCILLLLGGVTANDPYLPNPKVSPKPFYQLLAETYLEASRIILQRKDPSREVLDLPRLFLQAWEEWAKEPEDIGFELDGWGGGDSDIEDEDEDEDGVDDDEESDQENEDDE